MNPCVRYAPMLGARPGELSVEEHASLVEHLASCGACRARLADDQALQGVLGEALQREASGVDFSTFVDQVMERVGHPARARPWWRRPRIAASLLASALVALGAIVYLRGQTPRFQVGEVDVSSEDFAPTVLQSDDGPLVVLGEEEPEKT